MALTNFSSLFAFIAGVLTTLSPCVLPVLPFVTASSLNRNRFGPIALALGILVTFVGVSLAVQTTGSVLGIGPGVLRPMAGLFLSISGLLFVSQTLAEFFAGLLSTVMSRVPAVSAANHRFPLITEFINGFFLGIVWTPCSGPSLGTALGLAGQAGQLGQAAYILFIFGIGAVIPLIVFAYGARHLTQTVRKQTCAILIFKKGFGLLMMLFGLLIVTGYDRQLETLLLRVTPDSWLGFITKY